MSALEYLNKVLVKYSSKCSIITRFVIHTRLKELLIPWAGLYDINIVTSGSTTKKTAISLSSDLDYFVELPYSCDLTYKDMYNDMYKKLSNVYSARKQNVSIGIEIDNLKIDITPGIKQLGNTNYYNIYKSKSNSWTQTNITLHNQQISNSGRTSEIKLLKLWRELHNLVFPSIYLEYLLKDKILLNKSKTPSYLVDNFHYALKELAKEGNDNPLYSRIIDPSNSANVFSELINYEEKNKIIRQAKESINKLYWEDIVY
jgi:hypothetical protein